MLTVLYEDKDIIVVEKPVGMESQSAHGFEADMVSEIKKFINKLSTEKGEPYVGVVHRLDKPVGGIMVYAKNQRSAAALSKQVQESTMSKTYHAVVCGKPEDKVDNYVDYLLKDGKSNISKIVDKGIKDAKLARLSFRVLESMMVDENELTLVEIQLLTGRHHQIRVQFAGHGTPIFGDNKYNPQFNVNENKRGVHVALSACRLSFVHPSKGNTMSFSMQPRGEIFKQFEYYHLI